MKRKKLFLSIVIGLMALTGFSQENFFNGVQNTKAHSVVNLAENDNQFSIFLSFLKASGLETAIEYTDGYTVFMPTNEAFGKMEVEKLSKLTDPENKEKVVNFVKNYILPTKVNTVEFEDSQVIDVEGDETVNISADDNLIHIGGAQIIQGDIEAQDGVIHVINELITPTPDRWLN